MLTVKDLKASEELELKYLNYIKEEYLYSSLNVINFITKYSLTQGAFSYLLKKYNLKKDSKYILQSMKNTCVEKYGVDNIFKDVNYIQESFKKKYGENIVNPGQLKEVIEKEKKQILINMVKNVLFKAN